MPIVIRSHLSHIRFLAEFLRKHITKIVSVQHILFHGTSDVSSDDLQFLLSDMTLGSYGIYGSFTGGTLEF